MKPIFIDKTKDKLMNLMEIYLMVINLMINILNIIRNILKWYRIKIYKNMSNVNIVNVTEN